MTGRAPQRRQSWQDVVDVQAHLARWIDGTAGQRWLRAGYEENVLPLHPRTRGLLRALYDTESDRIRSADPIFVSSEMVEVIDAAMGRFEPEALLPTDLMTSHGFILYERPFEVPDRFDEPTSIQGFSWMPMLSTATADLLGERTQAEEMLRTLRQQHEVSSGAVAGDGIFLTVYAKARYDAEHVARYGPSPAIVPIHFTPWYFGMSFDGNDVDELGAKTAAEWWWNILQVTLRLMQQQLSVGHRYRPDKAGRRAARAAHLPEDRDVVVVRLRREKHSGPPDDGPHEEAHYSHRFVVHGFWRNQWYPSIKSHRQIYIHDFIKGPEDAPLIIRPNRAFTWTR